MSTWAVVAELVKTKNLSGALVAEAAPGLPFLLEEGQEVVFVPPLLDPPKRAKIQSITDFQDFSAQVVFTGIDNIDIANELVGRKCLVDLDTLAARPESRAVFLDGYQVVDARRGSLGEVLRVDVNPGQSVLVVRVLSTQAPVAANTDAELECAESLCTQKKASHELLIPLVDAFVQEINDTERVVRVNVPPDLLELNRG